MTRMRILAGAVAALAVLALPAAGLGAASVDIRGTWSFQPAGGVSLAAQLHVLTAGDVASGVFTGDTTLPNGNRFGTVTYTVDGLAFTAVNPYTGGGYTATWTGTIAPDGQTMSGSWTSNAGQAGQFTATRKRPSAVRVVCNRGPSPTDDAQCTAEVGDAGPAPGRVPTGTVTWSATVGSFPNGTTCTLEPSPGSPNVAFCAATYRGGPEGIPAGVALPVTATYGGDTLNAGASGSHELVQAGPPSGPLPGQPPPPPGAPDPCATASKAAGAKQSSQACPPRYTPEQKRDAEERRRAYANSNLYFQGMAVAWGGAAVYVSATGAGAPAGAVTGGGAVLFQGGALWAAYYQEQWARIVADPPDPRWRTPTAAPRVRAARIAVPAGLSPRQRRQVRAYLAAQLGLGAQGLCVSQAIDRGQAALEAGDRAAASGHYAAGSACSARAAAIAPTLPRLARPVAALVRPSDALLRGADRARVLRAARTPAARRLTLRGLAGVTRAVALPPDRLRALRAAAVARVGVPAIPPSALILRSAAQAAADAPALRASAAVLAAAAG